MSAEKLLNFVPDPGCTDLQKIREWLEENIRKAQSVKPDKSLHLIPVELKEVPDHPLGPESSDVWRRFLLAVLLADWACYDSAADRIDYDRLKYIMSSAYPFFRLWLYGSYETGFLPVGYTAWYPIARFIVATASSGEGETDDRGAFLPLRSACRTKKFDYAYVLNVSIVESLRNTPVAVRMLKSLRQDARKYPRAGIIAVTVDESGSRFSRSMRMKKAGEILVQGEKEYLYVRPATTDR